MSTHREPPRLYVPRPIAAQLREEARLAYPAECCGLLFGSDGHTVGRIVPMENLQDRLHALDPIAHPRTGRDGFEMNALAMLREIEAAAAKGERLLGIYHSHVDCDAYFSSRDKDAAAPPPDRVPHDPDLWHLVVACWADGVRQARAFRWNDGDFAACPVEGFDLAQAPAEAS
jgi:[CysO sulfur-carrier protein]-S-L-cysteine hydrolase